jgi:hypothetical protein
MPLSRLASLTVPIPKPQTAYRVCGSTTQAARIAALAQAGEGLGSGHHQRSRERLRDCLPRPGTHVLNGVPGEWKLFAPGGQTDPLADLLAATE